MDNMRAVLRSIKPVTFNRFAEALGDRELAFAEWNRMIEEDGLMCSYPKPFSRQELEANSSLRSWEVSAFSGYSKPHIHKLYNDFGIKRSVPRGRPKRKALSEPVDLGIVHAEPPPSVVNDTLQSHNAKYYKLMKQCGLCTESIGLFQRTDDARFAAVKVRLTPAVLVHKCDEVACPYCAALPIYLEPTRGIEWTSSEDRVTVLCASCKMVAGQLDVDPRGQVWSDYD